MRKLYLGAWGFVLCLFCPTSATTLDFEDLIYGQDLSGSHYRDLYWEFGNVGAQSTIGSWINPYPSDPQYNYFNFPNSGTHNLTNSWGCTEIGFKFPTSAFQNGVTVNGAFFAFQGDTDLWAESVRATGYKEDQQIWETDSLILSESPQWLAMGGESVDRVVIMLTPAEGNDYGWFGMDDLTFDKKVPEPMTLLFLALSAAAIRRRPK